MGRLQQRHGGGKNQKPNNRNINKQRNSFPRGKNKGPRLPVSLRKELQLQNPKLRDDDATEEEQKSTLPSDIYEYSEDDAPEETHKNRRFDEVDRLEYELPSDFEDEDIDEDAADGEDKTIGTKRSIKVKAKPPSQRKKGALDSSSEEENGFDGSSEVEGEDMDEEIDSDDIGDENESEEDDEISDDKKTKSAGSVEDEDDESDDNDDGDEQDDERHNRMIQAIRSARPSKENSVKKKKQMELISEAYPESEFNINPRPGADSKQLITLEDLINPLQSAAGFGSLRKRIQHLEKKANVVDAPLPKPVRERLSRKAGYQQSREEVSKWQDTVKKNREAPALVFTQRPDLMPASTAELVAKFEPKTDLEKQVASLLKENGLGGDEGNEDALGFNKISVAEVKERQSRLAKMRSMLSYHEAKAKRVKKIKSKTYHRLLQKGQKNKTEDELDPEAMKDAAIKAEYKRAQERMTLKHKNTSKWAKRIIKRGLKSKDEGTKEAIAEQLRVHAALTKKIHSATNASSSDDSSDESDTDSGGEDNVKGVSSTRPRSKLLAKAKMETLEVLEGDAEAEIPSSGLFSLPFMARAIEKKRRHAEDEAVAMLEQLEQLEYEGAGSHEYNFSEIPEVNDQAESSGRLAFGAMAKLPNNNQEQESEMVVERGSSSDEDEIETDCVQQVTKRTPALSKKRKAEEKKITVKVSDGSNLTWTNEVDDIVTQEEPIDKSSLSTSKKRKTKKKSTNSQSSNGLSFTVTGGSLKAGVKLRMGDSTDTPANPWLFGEANGKCQDNFNADGAGFSVDRNVGLRVSSTGVETVTVAGTKSNTQNAKTESKNGDREKPEEVMVEIPTVQTRNERSNVSSDSEDDGESEKNDFGLAPGSVSQAELIQRAFAGDNVEADFDQLKEQALSEEVPMGEASVTLPGWGQWTDVQKKKGPPLWMLKEQDELKNRRGQALKKRKDFKLKHVIISEKLDRKAEKFLAPSLPFPYKSKEVFERSLRMPLGREYNTDEAFRDMIRPAVVKDTGVIIDPIKYKMSQNKGSESDSVMEEKKKTKKKGSGQVNPPRLGKVAA